jgi:SWI/SNF-related matrix-associated actin-dependent regulator 1 of chromatin subfamily A
MSRNPYRLSFRRKGWMEITWHHEFQPPALVSNLMVDLARVPGIRHEPGWTMIEVPETAWSIQKVIALVGATNNENVFAARHPRYALQPEFDIWLREPYEWQKTGTNYALANGQGLVLCDAMGLGKTFTAICASEIAAQALGPDRPRLIIAPSFTRDVWLRELLASGVIESPDEFCALQTRDFNDVSWAKDAKWFFCHYDIIYNWYSRIVSSRRGKPVVAIVDEFHRVKNGKTQRAKGTHNAVAGAQFKMLLSGTPIDNAVGELWNPLTILHGSYTWGSPNEFRRRYAGALRGQFGMQDGIPSNIDELHHRMEPYYLRRTIEDTGEALPPLRRERLQVEMNATDLRAHHDIASVGDVREMVDAILEGRSSTAAFEILNKLRKLTSQAKLKTTIDFVGNLLEQGESVVVFCWQREMAKKVAFASNYSATWGGVSRYISG